MTPKEQAIKFIKKYEIDYNNLNFNQMQIILTALDIAIKETKKELPAEGIIFIKQQAKKEVFDDFEKSGVSYVLYGSYKKIKQKHLKEKE